MNKPFFARFLETETPPELREANLEISSDLKAGAGGTKPPAEQYPQTKKYPSDGEDSGNSGFLDYDY